MALGGIDPAAVWQVPGAVAPRCFVQQAVVTFSDIGITCVAREARVGIWWHRRYVTCVWRARRCVAGVALRGIDAAAVWQGWRLGSPWRRGTLRSRGEI